MQFDELRAAALAGDDVSVPPLWAQGRTVFGGLSGALLCDALQQEVDDNRRLRYLSVSFDKPLETSVPLKIVADTESLGRTLHIRSARLIQNDVTRVRARANFVTGLPGDLEISSFRAPDLAPREADHALHMSGPDFPAFTQHLEFYTTSRGLPFHSHEVPELGGWMRFKSGPERLTLSHLVCLIDSWPPAAVPYLDRPVPMSSINWVMHFGASVDEVAGDEFLGYLAKVNFFKDGFGSSSADIWTPDGRLLAKSFQTFLIYQ